MPTVLTMYVGTYLLMLFERVTEYTRYKQVLLEYFIVYM